jgi:hypothetical protein
MPPKPQVDAYTTEPVAIRARGRLGRMKDAVSEFKPPTEVRLGETLIESSSPHAERHSIALHNLALEQGYESQLIRFSRPRAFSVTVRQEGPGGGHVFICDPMLGQEGPKSEGRFRG